MALGACGIARQAFVQPSHGMPGVSVPTALRGAAQAPQTPNSKPTLALAAASVVAVGSFAGAARRKERVSTIAGNFNKESQLGAQAPLGFFDPAGFCEYEAMFKDFRAKELKHGRLATMGAPGMLTQSLVQVPGMEGVPKGVTACLEGNGKVGFLATLAIIGVLEAAVFVQDESKEPGHFGNPLPWWDDYSEEMRARELNNGRIAMFSAIGIIASSLYTGKSAVEQFGL